MLMDGEKRKRFNRLGEMKNPLEKKIRNQTQYRSEATQIAKQGPMKAVAQYGASEKEWSDKKKDCRAAGETTAIQNIKNGRAVGKTTSIQNIKNVAHYSPHTNGREVKDAFPPAEPLTARDEKVMTESSVSH